MQSGLLPGGPKCWVFEDGVARRIDAPDEQEYEEFAREGGGQWRRGNRGVGRGTTPADAVEDTVLQPKRLVAMMSPKPRQEWRAAGDRISARYAVYFDVEALLKCEAIELYVAYSGAIMCTTPVPPEFITAVQDTEQRRLLYSSAAAQFELLECQETAEGERCVAWATYSRDDLVDANPDEGQIVCPFAGCEKVINPGFLSCPWCGRKAVYRLRARKSEADMDTSGPTDDEDGEKPPRRVGRGTTPADSAKSVPRTNELRAEIGGEIGRRRLTIEERSQLHKLSRSENAEWVALKKRLKQCEAYGLALARDPTYSPKPALNYSMDPSEVSDVKLADRVLLNKLIYTEQWKVARAEDRPEYVRAGSRAWLMEEWRTKRAPTKEGVKAEEPVASGTKRKGEEPDHQPKRRSA